MTRNSINIITILLIFVNKDGNISGIQRRESLKVICLEEKGKKKGHLYSESRKQLKFLGHLIRRV